jgi:hypothetical protein
MDPAKAEQLIQQLAELVFSIDKDIAELEVSTAALKALSASQLRPDDPAAGRREIETLEEAARKADASAQRRREPADLIDAVKLIRKRGSHKT